jgi:GNAT superfamily N-acetyltransferase
MGEAISCRWAVAADYEAVKELSAQLASHIEEAPAAMPFEAFCASHLGPAAPMKLLVAERDGRVAGLAAWTVVQALYNAEAGLYLSDLVVDQGARGQGVGRALMETVKAWALAAGVRKLGWDVWHANTSAMAFYDGLGASADREAVPYRLSLEEA